MTTATACPQRSGRVRRRLAALGRLLARLALLEAALFAFLLFREPFSQFTGWLVAAVAIAAAGNATFSSFRRSWKGTSEAVAPIRRCGAEPPTPTHEADVVLAGGDQ